MRLGGVGVRHGKGCKLAPNSVDFSILVRNSPICFSSHQLSQSLVLCKSYKVWERRNWRLRPRCVLHRITRGVTVIQLQYILAKFFSVPRSIHTCTRICNPKEEREGRSECAKSLCHCLTGQQMTVYGRSVADYLRLTS